MKRLHAVIFATMLLLSLCSCGQKVNTSVSKEVPTWQEQYDLGVRYLSEGNYQEAIIAFTAAIEIDPRRPEAYIGLADVYTAQGDFRSAAEVLSRALEAVGEDEEILDILEQLESRDTDASGAGVRTERIDLEDGRYYINEYDADGFLMRNTLYNAAGTAEVFWEYEYDANGNTIRQTDYNGDGTLLGWHLYENDSNGNLLSISDYRADGTLQSMAEVDPDRNQIVRSTWYDDDGTVRSVEEYTG